MAMTHGLVIFSLSPRLGIWGVSLELMGRGVVSWTNEVSLSMSMYIWGVIHVCVLVCVALPMVVGAWSMVGVLLQLFEYYYLFVSCPSLLLLVITRPNPNTLIPTIIMYVLLTSKHQK